ncbi:aspartate aminotransferase family protein [Frankia sp. CNm7]|uniref:Aspartate aminotransferase family protein n=1 Tax=Frankia nepalensis TaxID=1836974 RepID=A0A937UME3_9ACTN|nr:aspartate aminotransferase family protein [Frankia nepalensis]MBL7511192.1 aspartate aminotransferase family protein [Frankia nepalensis]MBL7519084.1 aspartate aminotransferase family protein [Frankia nepalensis]MBL7626968.1 aspartate aminotransferase family protein [Frankia nepalensis]
MGDIPRDDLVDRLLATPKADVLAASERYWNPGKTRFWSDAGTPLVIGEREGYLLHDLAGHTLVDVHLNGGTYNLGHRNREVVATLVAALEHLDIGNHHFAALGRAALAEALVTSGPIPDGKVVFGVGGGEAIDIALKSARYATGRRKIVSAVGAFHGHTGLAVAAGNDRYAERFLATRPDEFVRVPFNDLDAMAAALEGGDVAAVLLETIPATSGFVMPEPGYLAEVAKLCAAAGTLYIADEVQTGLGRTGELWCISKHGVTPDLLVTGKGLSGGVYPVSATILGPAAAGWLEEDGFAHISTFGGSDLGCVVGLRTLEITQRPATRARVDALIGTFTAGLGAIAADNPDWLVEIRQDGLVIGLRFGHPQGARFVSRRLYEHGIWAIFSALDPRVLQFKPGLLLSDDLAADLLDRTATAVRLAADDARSGVELAPDRAPDQASASR